MALKKPLFLYNSLNKEKEHFTPLSKTVRIYSCGPTVYDRIHIGNLRSFLLADILLRTLSLNNFKTKAIQNITDVGHLVGDGDEGEDKLEVGSAREGKGAYDIAKKYTELYLEDAKAFNLLSFDVYPRATDHIPEQIEMIKVLLKKEVAYKTPDAIYFDTTKIKNYDAFGVLGSGASGESRLEEGKTSHKKHPRDFALWKFSPKNTKRQMEWDSPWGVGFPGWHIECSAMSYKYLGFPFDIHTGGVDHKPVHHTNEITQNEAFSGAKTINYWLHNEFVTIDNTKMSKSLGNTYTLDTLKERGYSPLSLRYLFLLTHYRQVLNFTWESLASADTAYKNVKSYLHRLNEEKKKGSFGFFKMFTEKKVVTNLMQNFTQKINDDLNTPEALAFFWETIKNTNLSPSVRLSFALSADTVLGLSLNSSTMPISIPSSIQELAQKRFELRKAGNWADADTLRKKIEDKGFLVEDTPEGFRILPR
jgi:cysteinyl-tRNA synthetase